MKNTLRLLAIIIMLMNGQLLLGQKGCDKKVIVTTDEFTGVTSVSTEIIHVMGKKGAGLLKLATGSEWIPE